MKEIPILFSAPMVRALLDGSKTQTRRVIARPLQHPNWTEYVYFGPSKNNPSCRSMAIECGPDYPDGKDDQVPCPYGAAGDRLWVRETWYCDHWEVQRGPYLEVPEARELLAYRADGERPYEAEQPVWRPSIHMPRWASRILLEVVSVRVERLNDINQIDAILEGAIHLRSKAWDREFFPVWRYEFDEAVANGRKPPVGPSPTQVYEALWESINGAGSWSANPWVWVVEFKRVLP